MSTTAIKSEPIDFCGVVCDFVEELIEKAKLEVIKEFAEKAVTELATNYSDEYCH